MDLKDYIGKRGERVFSVLITKWCDGRPWFDDQFLGEKAEAKDFMVNLIEPSSGDATFYVQVKATTKGYKGKGANRRLRANVSKADVEKLKKIPGPAFVAGIDINLECGFLVAITKDTAGGIWGIPVGNPINCTTILNLWKEVDAYWANRNMLAKKSLFS